ncbi:alpha-amylase family glycosyl hydrolase [Saxibacter everestensis]|uniref:Alpha-amylase family glycosyl hydrolase n=1 Tax=Saxibacter everestensis TaxID=2909229 RepID=A0ABY8QST8_9MICO|nr:alpha-amylase family glycosyl hydrolase [Brevibacteriaceae bacterium ZFBP1038]
MSDQQSIQSDPNWWRQAAVYQIYPRSFADANGDGIGDLRGVTSRLPYLSELGIDAVWLSPFYPSELADGGYDVADYRDVDPRIGSLDDFDTMMAKANELGIRIIVDIVPNHSSDQHAWFQEALAAEPGSPERDRYIFRDGKGPDGAEPPSNWVSHFGGSAWTRVPDGQWYLHLFAREQPDFNWTNTQVREDFKKTLRFWSDRGVAGFRIDVAHALAKDLPAELPDLPPTHNDTMTDFPTDGSHPLYDRHEVHEIYREWREVFDEYDPPRTAVAEAWVANERRVIYAQQDLLGQAFNFEFLEADWDAAVFRAIIDSSLASAAEVQASATWVLSNHDVVRHPSRYALPADANLNEWLLSEGHTPEPNPEQGLRRARAATMLMLALPGSSYLYQGEELGLFEVADLPTGSLQDPQWERTGMTSKGRDGCRVPLPWNRGGPSFGFGGDAWLPQPDWYGESSVEAEDGVPDSMLSLYREALRLRRDFQGDENLTWSGDAGSAQSVLHFRRSTGWESVTNFSSGPVPLPEGKVLLSSQPLSDGQLPGETTVWLER